MENHTSFYGKGPKSFYNKRNSYGGGEIEVLQEADIESVSIASFNTNIKKPLKSLKVGIEPVQDLHGYYNPWVPGGGKNIADLKETTVPISSQSIIISGAEGNLTFTSTANYGRAGYFFPTKTGETYTISFTYNKTQAHALSTVYLSNSFEGTWKYDTGRISLGNQVVSKDTYVSQTIVATSDTLFVGFYVSTGTSYPDTITIKNFQIEVGSAATSYAPYANICPITGWTGAKVTRCGKNLLPIPTETVTLLSGVVVSASEGELQITGTGNSYGTYNIDLPYTIPAGTQMILNGNVTGNGVVAYRIRNIDGKNYEQINLNTPKSVSFAVNRLQVAVNPNAEYSYTIKKIQLEFGSTATDYEPYQGKTYDIAFPSEAGTVYGGTLDVTNGVLMVDRIIFERNTSTMDNAENYPGWKNAGVRALGYEGIGSLGSISSISGSFYYNINGSNDLIYINKSGVGGKTQTEMQALAIDMQIIIPLKTPQTYHLTPTEIETLLRENNIWADTGDIEELTYLIRK